MDRRDQARRRSALSSHLQHCCLRRTFSSIGLLCPPAGGQSGREEDARLRLRPGVVPSQFTFRPKVQARPSPIDRRQAAALRVAACKATANQESFGPKTKLQTVEEELLEAKKRIGELEAANTKLQAEVDDLRTQVFRFESIKDEGAQLQFFTDLSKDMWSALWDFLKPTRENLLSASSAAAEASGRVNAPGAGRPPTLSMEDELLMTLMRIRLAREEQDLAYHFGVSQSTVSRITSMWINILYLRLGLIPIWPKWQDSKKRCQPHSRRRIHQPLPSLTRRSWSVKFRLLCPCRVSITQVINPIPQSRDL